jgi:hypothetical protein
VQARRASGNPCRPRGAIVSSWSMVIVRPRRHTLRPRANVKFIGRATTDSSDQGVPEDKRSQNSTPIAVGDVLIANRRATAPASLRRAVASVGADLVAAPDEDEHGRASTRTLPHYVAQAGVNAPLRRRARMSCGGEKNGDSTSRPRPRRSRRATPPTARDLSHGVRVSTDLLLAAYHAVAYGACGAQPVSARAPARGRRTWAAPSRA